MPKSNGGTLTKAEQKSIDNAMGALTKGLPGHLPFDKARSALKRWLQKSKAHPIGKTRHGNSGQFKAFYFPIIKKLHEKNPQHLWTLSELAGRLVEYVEKHPSEVPEHKRLSINTLRKHRLKKYEGKMVDVGLSFTKRAPSNQGSAKVP